MFGWFSDARFGFALKPSQPIVIRRDGRRQDYGDLALQPGVGGPIHLPDSALTEQGGDFIDAETVPEVEPRVTRLYGRDGRRARSANLTPQGGTSDEAVGDGEGGRRRCQVEISQEEMPKQVLAPPDLDTQTAELNSLSSASGQRNYEYAIRDS